jgi:putative ABC transport system permease protein
MGAIAFGVAGLVLGGGFIKDLLEQLRESTIHSRLGHIQVFPRGYSLDGAQRPIEYLLERPAQIEKIVDALPGVVARTKRLAFSGLVSNGRGERPIIGEGVEPAPEAKIGTAISITNGQALTARSSYDIVVGEGLAKSMQMRVGDNVNLVVSTREGALNTLDFNVVGLFRSNSREYDARAVLMPLKAAQDLLMTSAVNAVVVLLSNTDDTAARAAELAARLPSDFEVRTWQDRADFYNSTVALYRRQFGFLLLIVLVIVVLGVANSVNLTLHERTVEFGIMRALGRTRRHVFRVAVFESLLLGLAGSFIGVLAGIALALLISAIGIPMPPPPNSDVGYVAAIRLAPSFVGVAFAIGVLAAVCGALLPAHHLARIPLVDALRRGI